MYACFLFVGVVISCRVFFFSTILWRIEMNIIPAVGVERHLSLIVGDGVARQRDGVDDVVGTWPEVGVAGVRARAQTTKTTLVHRVVYTYVYVVKNTLAVTADKCPNPPKTFESFTLTKTSCRRVAATICHRPLKVDNISAFIRQVAPVPVCWAI